MKRGLSDTFGDDVARLVAADEAAISALLASLAAGIAVGYPARRLRPGEDVEVAALVDAERARRRRRLDPGGDR